ncbi:MAG: hypothetical protein SGPRY_007195, partial [Prymnesium sp.]
MPAPTRLGRPCPHPLPPAGAKGSAVEINRAASDSSRLIAAGAATAIRRSAAMESHSGCGPPHRANPVPHKAGREAREREGFGMSMGEGAGKLRSEHSKDAPSRAFSTGSARGGRKPVDRGIKVAITLMTRKPHRFD